MRYHFTGGATNVTGRRRRGYAQRIGVTAGFTLAGAGAGLTAATAAVGNTWARTVWAVVGAALGLVGSTMADRVYQRRQAKAEAVRERDSVMGPIVTGPMVTGGKAREDSVFDLLLAAREVTPFWGRQADLAWLEKWWDDPHASPVAIVTGPAGVGKTRLLTHFTAQRREPWEAGWLNPGRGPEVIAAALAGGDPTLLVIDDCDDRPDTIAVLERLATSDLSRSPVRVMLASRAAGLAARLEKRLPDRCRWVIADAWERPIGGFGTAEDYARWFREAVRSYARELGTPPPDLPEGMSARSFNVAEPILTLQAQALETVLESRRKRPMYPTAKVLRSGDVAALLFTREEHRWLSSAMLPEWGLTDLTGPNQRAAIAALVLSSPSNQAQAAAALRRVPDLADASAERLANIARWAASQYPASPPWPIRIKPDMLAEWFVVTQVERTPELADILRALALPEATATLTLLAQASDHMPAAVQLFADLISTDPISLAGAGIGAALTATAGRRGLDGELARLLLATTWSDDLLRPVEGQLIAGLSETPVDGQLIVGLPGTEAAIAQARVRIVRAHDDAASLSASLATLGGLLAKLGRFDDALAATDESVDLYRRLAQDNPALQPDLAGALTSLGIRLAEVGQFTKARDRAEEAVGLHRKLAQDSPAQDSPAQDSPAQDSPAQYLGLAEALASLGSRLAELGHADRALAAAEESVTLHRQLAGQDPARQPDLAKSLNSFGKRLFELGRFREARAAAEESVGLYRRLAQDNPALRPDLAAALTSLGIRLAELLQDRAALAAAEESAGMYRQLAEHNPAYYPGLAKSLTSLAERLRAMSRTPDALPVARESVAVFRLLARDYPVLQSDLAWALTSLGICLDTLGMQQKALAAAEESVSLYRLLADENRAIRPDLARSLNSLGIYQAKRGRVTEAVTTAEEAVGLFKPLAQDNPALQRFLGISLINLTNHLERMGRHQDALARAEECVAVWHSLARADPGFAETYRGELVRLERLRRKV